MNDFGTAGEVRAERERATYADTGFRARRRGLRKAFAHVYQCPNSSRREADFQERLLAAIPGRRVLDVGCGTGWNSTRLLDWGAQEVVGIDISPDQIAEAQKHAEPNLSFRVHDLHEPLDREFDVIIGRAILHHLRWKDILPRLLEQNLAPKGKMLFIEPSASGLLMKLYWRFGQAYHTPDEAPFYSRDIRWLESRFNHIDITGYNWTSLPAGVVSGLLFSQPDNWLTRLADRVDARFMKSSGQLKSRGRSVIIEIEKAGESPPSA